MKFTEFNIHEDLLNSISYMGFEEATPVQIKAIPVILEGKDLIACAQTGTGKTAAFVLPILDRIARERYSGTSTLIIVPTRELAIQIDQQIQGIGYVLGLNSIAVYGGGDGEDWGLEKKALSSGADIIVATPGKLISHLNMGYVKFDKIKHLVLDEADRMLDIGFFEDIIKIISFLPKQRQTLMFSATMAPKIKKLAAQILVDPFEVSIAVSKPAEGVLQAAYLAYDNQKPGLIDYLISDRPDYESILIFCSTKKKVAEIARLIKKTEKETESISSDLEQSERERVMLRFKARKTRILVATDVLSRGIDIKDINLIINYDVPGDAEDYVHRIGRTARADATGVALTFINPDDMYAFSKIERLIEKEVYKIPLPPELGEGPEWKVSTSPGRNYRKKQGRPKGKQHGYKAGK